MAFLLKEAAARHPYKRAVVSPLKRDGAGRVAYTHLTFSQLDAESDRLARGLVNTGIDRGVRVVLMVSPGLDFFALVFALFKVGAVPVVVDPGMGLKKMLACLKESQPTAFIGIPKAHAVRVFCPSYFKSVKINVTVGRRWFWGGRTLRDLRVSPWKPFPPAKTAKNETAAILFTTGSTGPAKGVVYTHGIFTAQVKHIRDHFKIRENEVDLPTFPLFALFDPALGMTAVIPDMDPTRPARANPKKIIEAVLNQGVTNMFASPALLNRVGRYGEVAGIKLPPLKRVVSAGAPVLPPAIARFRTVLTDDAALHTPYGATEAVPVISIESGEILSQTASLTAKGYGVCVGRPLAGIQTAIIKISDAPIAQWSPDLILPSGEIGEIVVKGDLVTREYYQRPNQTRLAKIADGREFWHRMGDLGWWDSKGRIWFCGRKSHRVVTEKETLYTIPCEAIFNAHPKVFRSALVGVGEQGKKVPVIYVETKKSGQPADKKKLRDELMELARSSVVTSGIRHVLFVKNFPVDIRHNSKIFREKLTILAERKIKVRDRNLPWVPDTNSEAP